MANFPNRHFSALLHSALKQNETRIIQDPQQADRIQKLLAQMEGGILQEKLAQLDLSPIAKAVAAEKERSWNEGQIQLALVQYLFFLFLSYLHPSQILVPSKNIDLVWHKHLLQDTRQYARDCEMLFDGFVHHVHQSQLWDNATEAKTDMAYQQTRSLMREYLQGSEDDLAQALLAQDLPKSDDKQKPGACGHPV